MRINFIQLTNSLSFITFWHLFDFCLTRDICWNIHPSQCCDVFGLSDVPRLCARKCATIPCDFVAFVSNGSAPHSDKRESVELEVIGRQAISIPTVFKLTDPTDVDNIRYSEEIAPDKIEQQTNEIVNEITVESKESSYDMDYFNSAKNDNDYMRHNVEEEEPIAYNSEIIDSTTNLADTKDYDYETSATADNWEWEEVHPKTEAKNKIVTGNSVMWENGGTEGYDFGDIVYEPPKSKVAEEFQQQFQPPKFMSKPRVVTTKDFMLGDNQAPADLDYEVEKNELINEILTIIKPMTKPVVSYAYTIPTDQSSYAFTIPNFEPPLGQSLVTQQRTFSHQRRPIDNRRNLRRSDRTIIQDFNSPIIQHSAPMEPAAMAPEYSTESVYNSPVGKVIRATDIFDQQSVENDQSVTPTIQQHGFKTLQVFQGYNEQNYEDDSESPLKIWQPRSRRHSSRNFRKPLSWEEHVQNYRTTPTPRYNWNNRVKTRKWKFAHAGENWLAQDLTIEQPEFIRNMGGEVETTPWESTYNINPTPIVPDGNSVEHYSSIDEYQSRQLQRELAECCSNSGVDHECMPLCDYNSDRYTMETIVSRDHLRHCRAFVGHAVMCANQNIDNTHCCAMRSTIISTSPNCQRFCDPGYYSDANGFSQRDYKCVQDWGTIMMCHKEGLLAKRRRK